MSTIQNPSQDGPALACGEEYDIEATARRTCHQCADLHHIHVSLPDHSIEDVTRYLKMEIGEKMERDGWLNGRCPECAIALRAEIAAGEKADNARKEMEVDS